MAGYTKVKKPPAPFTTLSGLSGVECVAAGRFRGRPGGPIYVSVDRELRGICAAAGWPNPEQHAEAVADRGRLAHELEQALARVAELEAENEKLRGALVIVRPQKAKMIGAAA